MSKAIGMLLLLFAFVSIVVCGGCGHKPAYSDIDVNRNARNQNAGEQSGTQPPPASEPVRPKMPAFMSPNGTIKDLPSYPRSTRVNVQIGPLQGQDTMTLNLRTRDSMENVQAFYEKAIKENQWTVVEKVLDPEMSVWTLKTDDDNSARVQAKKDPGRSIIDVFLIRAQKIADTK